MFSCSGPVVTDHGNLILDVVFGEMDNDMINNIDFELHKIPGVIETGLFVNMAQTIYIGEMDGTVTKINKDNKDNNFATGSKKSNKHNKKEL